MSQDNHNKTIAFYTEFFTKTGDSISRYPNPDEVRRANQVLSVLTQIATEHDEKYDRPLRILDMGCGRGWLTFMLGMYGEVMGVEPIPTVVDYARQLYPEIEFMEGTSKTLLNLDEKYQGYFDVVVSSEVIEHVPYPQQQQFMIDLATLVRDGGDIVMSTPRGEIYDEWMKQAWVIAQPVEDWVTERRFDDLIAGANLKLKERVVFRKFQAAVEARFYERTILAIARVLGFQNSEPIALTVYQLVWIKK